MNQHYQYLCINTIPFLGKEASPFQCAVCSRCYRQKINLARHIKFECGKEPSFKCTYNGCDYKSKWKGNLKDHMRRHDLNNFIGIPHKYHAQD